MVEFKKRIYSGWCLCGHKWDEHHLGCVVNPEAYEIIGPYVPGECLFYGCNEEGGLDNKGNYHCGHYVDVENPDQELINSWQGTRKRKRKKKWIKVH